MKKKFRIPPDGKVADLLDGKVADLLDGKY
jgi:hypothetical protein